MIDNENSIVEITDEEGNVTKVEVIDLVTVDNVEYAILAPVCEHNHEECDCEDEDDFVLMRVVKDGEDYSFETIDDDDEFEKVAAYIDELADEADE